MEHSRGEFTMEPIGMSPELQRSEMAGYTAVDGKDSKPTCYSSTTFQEHLNTKESKKLNSDRNDSFQDPRPKKRKKVTFRDTNHAVANRATK